MKSIEEIREAFLRIHRYATTDNAPAYMSVPADPERDADLILSNAVDELERLRSFKAYVHVRLDNAGVPVDPPGPHRDAGCRIGQRLDQLLDERTALLARCVSLEAEADDDDRLRERLHELLRGVAIGLFGPEPELVRYDLSHLPRIAAEVRAAGVEVDGEHPDRHPVNRRAEELKAALTGAVDRLAEVSNYIGPFGTHQQMFNLLTETINQARAVLASRGGA